MSSYLRGGTVRAYGFDLENIVKSSSTTSSRTSHSHSSSTLSESSNSPNVISTRKPRTPRKRPNQTYNEAAALLSTACPTIFSITKKSNKQQSEFPNHHTYFLKEPLELLLPFPGIKRPSSKVTPRDIIEYNGNWNCRSSCNSIELREGYQDDDFDTESILDEEIEEGIDSIMGNSNSIPNEKSCVTLDDDYDLNCNSTCYGYPIGLGFGGNLEFNFGFGLRNGVRALKNVDERNWWSFPAVNLINISSTPGVEKKKKVEDLMKLEPKLGNRPVVKEESLSLDKAPRLLLKLNYDNVLNAWSDKGSPLPEEMLGSECPGGDIYARLAQIDLFSENGGGVREASVNRYKEKRQTRLFSKKIRYQVRKVNADRRPRSKGRFIRRPANPPICEET